MAKDIHLDPIRDYFIRKLKDHGPTYKGVDCASDRAQEVRFDQLARIFNNNRRYVLLDYGCGYGAMLSYLLRQGHEVDYWGYDIVEEMVAQGEAIYKDNFFARFTTRFEEVPDVDYAVASGTFNLKLDAPYEDWTQWVVKNIARMNERSRKGFSFNLLTSYSDLEYMRGDLYYADPCFYFDYCKRHFSKNVAVLHDYGLYDFTVLVRKDL